MWTAWTTCHPQTTQTQSPANGRRKLKRPLRVAACPVSSRVRRRLASFSTVSPLASARRTATSKMDYADVNKIIRLFVPCCLSLGSGSQLNPVEETG
jgi:hypothetical protein